MVEFVIVYMGGLVESDLAIIVERSESNDRHLARFHSQKIHLSYYLLIKLIIYNSNVYILKTY